MAGDLYELVALGMRYWFALLGVIIVWRAARWALADHRRYLRTLRQLPYAGLMGEIVDLASGNSYPLPREGALGSGKGCDIRLPGLRKREFEFALREGHGVALIPSHRQHQLSVDGKPMTGGDYALHGAHIGLPGYQLRMRLFANLDIPLPYGEHPYEEPEAVQEDAQAPPDDDFDMTALDGFVLKDVPGAEEYTLEGTPARLQPHPELEMTWVYALPPPELQTPGSEQPPPPPRSRRSRRHGK